MCIRTVNKCLINTIRTNLSIYCAELCRRPSQSLYKSLIIRVGERKFHVIFALGSKSSRGRKLQGTKVPWSESSTYGTFAPGSESTWERKLHNSRSHQSTPPACTHCAPLSQTVLAILYTTLICEHGLVVG